jgi:hypothetical protein
MERGQHPNSQKALELNREKTQFCGESAVKAAKKKHEKETVTKELMEAVANKLDIDKASAKLAELVAKGDLNAWKLWLEYTASKPATKVEMDNKMVFSFGEDDTEDTD